MTVLYHKKCMTRVKLVVQEAFQITGRFSPDFERNKLSVTGLELEFCRSNTPSKPSKFYCARCDETLSIADVLAECGHCGEVLPPAEMFSISGYPVAVCLEQRDFLLEELGSKAKSKSLISLLATYVINPQR